MVLNMYIENLRLLDFRNYSLLDINFGRGINIIYGDNAQGKTNILEAIYFFAGAKSHRTNKEKELIFFNSAFSKLNIKFYGHKRQNTGEIKLFSNNRKQIKINDIIISKISSLIGQLNLVFFSPEDLNLVKEGPVQRRKFLDIGISQLRPNYYNLLLQYEKVLEQRNNLLKAIVANHSLSDTLDIWNQKLADIGSPIMQHRYLFIDKLKNISRNIHLQITDNKEELTITYVPGHDTYNFNNLSKLKADFLLALEQSLENDLKIGATHKGPHRDDLDFFINDKDVRSFASQGQQRTVVLSMKMSEMEFVNEDIGEYPVLLLDDIMSELDKKRQNDLLSFINDKQVIITCTDYDLFGKSDGTCVFHVKGGEIMKGVN